MSNIKHDIEDNAGAEPTTLADAEAVLIALGTTLPWKGAEGGGFKAILPQPDRQPGQQGQQDEYSMEKYRQDEYYYVSPGGSPYCPGVRVSKNFWDSSVQACATDFANVEEGIAACELHYKTYKWLPDLVWQDWPIPGLLAQKRAWLGRTAGAVMEGGRCYVLDQVEAGGSQWTAHQQTQQTQQTQEGGNAVVVRSEVTQPMPLNEAKAVCERHHTGGKWHYPTSF